ncbi:helix-turn-helix domain-containing protein [Methylobacterium oryzihabitans]|uniref:XRE family transcriptional regulator n=1 Tax=Methylobacterium oryzihabitans TaxID=2499852 RepID=A0A437NUQ2_9HYPH|nr:helix-turn-helix transcriptional regulator [Methylobacterium oryzihabitans]RVU13756.1 XRE family transcriptional regulator [Methylobacterium oryzihabitans]
MTVQFITTPAGEELAILPRRDYDALLARLGDEAAEDRATARIVDEHLAAVAAGTAGPAIPHWFVMLLAEHGSTVTAARKHHDNCTQAQLAEAIGISQGHLSDIERGRRALTREQARQVAAHTGVEAEWLL